MTFMLNGIYWHIVTVPPYSSMLIDRTGRLTVATTDPRSKIIFLSDELSGGFRETVILHELGHAVMFSYGLLQDLHSFVPREKWIYAEEWLCNFLADYARRAIFVADDVIDDLQEQDMWQTITIIVKELFR